MKKLGLFLTSIIGTLSSIFSQEIPPFVEIPDSEIPFPEIGFYNRSFEVGDLDGDGFDDVLFYSRGLFSFQHMHNLGNGEFAEIDSAQSPFAAMIESWNILFPDFTFSNVIMDFVDIDSDGDLDVHWECDMLSSQCGYYYNTGNAVLFFENSGAGVFETDPADVHVLFNECTSDLDSQFIDIDLDGDIDWLLTYQYYNSGSGKSSYYNEVHTFNTATLQLELSSEEEFEQFYLTSRRGDLNQDGLEDILGFSVIHYMNTGEDQDSDQFFDVELLATEYPFNYNPFPWPYICIDFEAGMRLIDIENDGLIEVMRFYGSCSSAVPPILKIFSQNCALSDKSSCDDGLPCTEGEYWYDCECIGAQPVPDEDNDGVCNTLDQCPGEDDTIDNNNDDIPDCLQVVGLSEIIENQINIFPNPSSGELIIDTDFKLLQLNLFNAIGEELPVFYIDQNRIDLSNYSQGMYILEMHIEEGVIRKKVYKSN